MKQTMQMQDHISSQERTGNSDLMRLLILVATIANGITKLATSALSQQNKPVVIKEEPSNTATITPLGKRSAK